MNYKDCDDRQLVAAIVSNDVEAIKYFFNEKCSGLFAYIMANVFDNNVPKDDLPQELFLYLAQNNWYKYGAQNEVYNDDWAENGLIVLCFS